MQVANKVNHTANCEVVAIRKEMYAQLLERYVCIKKQGEMKQMCQVFILCTIWQCREGGELLLLRGLHEHIKSFICNVLAAMST